MNDSTPTHQPEASANLRDAVAESLRDLYVCSRVWSAWQVGTMTQDDFSPAEEDENVIDNIVAAVLAAQPPAAPAQVGTSGASAEEERENTAWRDMQIEHERDLDHLHEVVNQHSHDAMHWFNVCNEAHDCLRHLLEECKDAVDCGNGFINTGRIEEIISRDVGELPARTEDEPQNYVDGKVGTEDADAQARLIAALLAVQMNAVCIPDTPGEQAISTATLKTVEDALGAYSLTIPAADRKTLMVTACCGAPHAIGTFCRPPRFPEAMAPAAPVAAVGEAVPLTHEQIDTIHEQVYRVWAREMPSQPLRHSFARAVEAAHGILPAASMGAK